MRQLRRYRRWYRRRYRHLRFRDCPRCCSYLQQTEPRRRRCRGRLRLPCPQPPTCPHSARHGRPLAPSRRLRCSPARRKHCTRPVRRRQYRQGGKARASQRKGVTAKRCRNFGLNAWCLVPPWKSQLFSRLCPSRAHPFSVAKPDRRRAMTFLDVGFPAWASQCGHLTRRLAPRQRAVLSPHCR